MDAQTHQRHSGSLCLLKLVKEKKVHTQDLPSCGENRMPGSGRAASLAEPPKSYQYIFTASEKRKIKWSGTFLYKII
jgi:hypothetical protein